MEIFNITLIIVFIILAIAGILILRDGWPCGFDDWGEFITILFYVTNVVITFVLIFLSFRILIYNIDWQCIFSW